MRNVSQFNYCYGCGVCAVACPHDAISMHINCDGFYSSFVDKEKCIDCGICLTVCTFYYDKVMQDRESNIQSKAVWSRDDGVRYNSTSGGVGFEIGCYLLGMGFKAIVCRYNPDNNRAEHYIAETEEDLKASIGSKYIQSDFYNGLSQIVTGQRYFITGTPCQIDSVRRWVRKNKKEDYFVLLDFFCHGVPSMLLWDKYTDEVESLIGKFGNILWRDKEAGWHDSWVMKVPGRYSSWFSKGDLFYSMFLGNRCLGRQCYENCKYKYDHSAADIRIGDLWGCEYAKDEKGVNGVICFTHKGSNILDEMKDKLYIVPSSLDIVCESQMKKCARRPASYKYVMRQLKTSSSLADINRTAFRMELIDRIMNRLRYYTFRLPSKILEVTGLKGKFAV